MEPNRFPINQSVREGVIDAGLKAHMQRVYNRMTVGVLVTALTAWVVSSSQTLTALFLGGPQAFVIMLAPLAIVWFGFRPETMSSSKLRMVFFALCVLYGISFATIGLVFTGESIAKAFFVATGAFAGLSIFGYTTRKNLDGLGAFAVMGVWGLLFLSLGTLVAGMFGVETSGMQNIIAGIGIVAFAGVTAWQTQATKEMYHPAHGDEINSRMAWSAALTLYISFIAMFQYILQLMGNRQ